MEDSRHRPLYHFVPPANWMNDPNGLLQWRGRYHLFYQYNPNGPVHGTIHWGHAVSDDLVHWRDLPIALAPTPGGPDKDGVFSGCAVVRDGVPTLVYTGIGPEVQCIAQAADPDDADLTVWHKHDANPVIAEPPPDLQVRGFRDPFVWREDDGWYCAIGSGIKGAGGAVLLYRSQDLLRWEYLHELSRNEAGDGDRVGDRIGDRIGDRMWECPNFFPLGDRHVLLVSSVPSHAVLAMTGEYRAHRFTPDSMAVLGEGGSFYAPQVMLDEHGRRLIWGWLREDRSAAAQVAAGWSGVLSLPAELSLNSDGALCARPAAELTSLRAAHRHYDDALVAPGRDGRFDALSGTQLEIEAVLLPGTAREAGLLLFESPDGAERTRLYFDRDLQQVVIDRTHTSLDTTTVRDVRSASLRLGPADELRLRVFLDGSVIEVFANGGLYLACRVYPTLGESRHVRPFANGGAATLRSLDAWELRSIWPAHRDALPTLGAG